MSAPLKLHIISSDVPYPPDYGGMVDVYFKIRNLHEAGVELYLHCFEYGRGMPEALNAICKKVFYYKRKTGIKGISLLWPYMLYSRRSHTLLQNLQSIDAPILFEGVHTAFYLSHPSLKHRIKLMRNQNLEQEYYALLGKREKNGLKKLYYFIESFLLKKVEHKLHAADAFLTVAEHDHLFFKKLYPQKQHSYIPSFQPYNQVTALSGHGSYVLYHGNLGHSENIEAALFLLREVCPLLPQIQFVFAGKNPNAVLAALCGQYANCCLMANPTMEEMEGIVANAQIHLLPTFQATGLKLKLLHALFNGRHVLVNEAMVAGTGLETVCTVAKDASDFVKKIEALYVQPFTEIAIAERNAQLLVRYNNIENTQKIIHHLQQV